MWWCPLIFTDYKKCHPLVILSLIYPSLSSVFDNLFAHLSDYMSSIPRNYFWFLPRRKEILRVPLLIDVHSEDLILRPTQCVDT